MKNLRFLWLGVLLIIMISIIPVSALELSSAEEPKFATCTELNQHCVGDSNIFLANGTPITIAELKEDGYVAVVRYTWQGEDKQVKLKSGVTVIGGGHNKYYDTSNITMEGGEVRNIIGGGLHGDVNTAIVTMNGGKVTGAINGGGAASFIADDHWTDDFTATDKDHDRATVSDAKVIINNGEIGTVFGGGEGKSYTQKNQVEITGGTIDHVIASGSNGWTDESEVVVRGGEIEVLHSINRGEMQKATISVTDGKVNQIYVGGESTREANCTGKVEEISISVTEPATVTKISYGLNNGTEIKDHEEETQISVVYDEASVEELETELQAKALAQVVITFQGQEYHLNKGENWNGSSVGAKALQQALSKSKNVEGKTYYKFVNDKNEQVTNKTQFQEDTTITTLYTVEVTFVYPGESDQFSITGILEGTRLGEYQASLEAIQKAENKIFSHFEDQDGNEVTEDTILTKNITVKAMFKVKITYVYPTGDDFSIVVPEGTKLEKYQSSLEAIKKADNKIFSHFEDQNGNIVDENTIVSENMIIHAVYNISITFIDENKESWSVIVPEGTSLGDLKELEHPIWSVEELKNVEGKTFVEFINNDTKETILEETPITENITVSAIYEEMQSGEPGNPNEGENQTPSDSDNNEQNQEQPPILEDNNQNSNENNGTIENPSTFDGVMKFVGMIFFSMIAFSFGITLLKRKNLEK